MKMYPIQIQNKFNDINEPQSFNSSFINRIMKIPKLRLIINPNLNL